MYSKWWHIIQARRDGQLYVFFPLSGLVHWATPLLVSRCLSSAISTLYSALEVLVLCYEGELITLTPTNLSLGGSPPLLLHLHCLRVFLTIRAALALLPSTDLDFCAHFACVECISTATITPREAFYLSTPWPLIRKRRRSLYIDTVTSCPPGETGILG